MRSPFTTAEALGSGFTKDAIAWRVKTRQWIQAERGVYVQGDTPLSPMESAISKVVVSGGVASGSLAASLMGLDGVELRQPFVTVGPGAACRRPGLRSGTVPPDATVLVAGIPCTSGALTLVDLASNHDDREWEHAFESALRAKIVSVPAMILEVERLKPQRYRGIRRVRRVMALRPQGAPPTESMLETLMVQLIRSVPALPQPERQLDVHNAHGELCGRVDLAWPTPGVFIELDGQQHAGQPVYDARRETAIVAATGWYPARFTWTEVRYHPKATGRRLLQIYEMARRRLA